MSVPLCRQARPTPTAKCFLAGRAAAGYFGDYKTGEWTNMARHTVAKNAYRLRERDEPNNRIKHLKKHEIVYACTKADQRSWYPADTKMIIKQLDKAEAMITRLITGRFDIILTMED